MQMLQAMYREWPFAIHRLQHLHAAIRLQFEPRLHRAAKTVPPRQHQAALRPAEDPRDRAQILNAFRGFSRAATAADVRVSALTDHRGLADTAVDTDGS